MGRGLPTEALLHRWGKGQLPSLRGLQSSSLCPADSTPEHTGICSVAVRWGALKGSTSWLKARSYALWITREGVKVMEGDTDRAGTRDDIPSFFPVQTGPSSPSWGLTAVGQWLLFPPRYPLPLSTRLWV